MSPTPALSTALAVLLLRSCNLNDIDHQIISRSLNFDVKTFDKTKAAVIAHEVTKRANHQSLPGFSAVKETKNLATFPAEDLELDPSELNDLKVWITDRRKAGKDHHRFPKNKWKWKCDYCLCQHPKWDHSCGCPCTKHSKEHCPNPDPERKKKADLAEAMWKKKKQQAEAGSGAAGTMLVQETTAAHRPPPGLPQPGRDVHGEEDGRHQRSHAKS